MIVILILLTVVASSFVFELPTEMHQLSVQLHEMCLRNLPSGVQNAESLEALVCGKNFENLELKHLFSQSALIHIFVVSGTHFILLHKILAFLFRSRWWPFLPLGLYALATLCQPPGVRSLFFLLLVELHRHYKTFCSQIISIFMSALLSIALFPEWLSSRSLLMSLMAALVISVTSEFLGKERETLPAMFITQSLIYFFMGFCLWGLSNLHPLSIVMNLVLGPVVGLLLFPLALLSVALPAFAPLFDGLMNTLILILQQTTEVLAGESDAKPLTLAFQWCLFLTLLTGCYFLLVRRKRQEFYER